MERHALNKMMKSTSGSRDIPIRVMHLVHNAYPFKSGYTIRGKTIFESQARAGIKVAVVGQHLDGNSSLGMCETGSYYYLSQNGVDYYVYRKGSSVIRRFPDKLVDLRKRGIRGCIFIALIIDEMIRFNFVCNMFRAIRPDLVHAHTGVGLYGKWLNNRFGIPWVYEMRGFWEDSFAAEEEYGTESKNYVKSHLRDTKLAMAADATVVISHAMRQDVIRRGVAGGKVSVVPNVVDTALFNPIDRKDPELLEELDFHGKIVAGYLTNIRKLEGLETLIRAVPLVLREVANFCVVIVGDGSDRARLEKLVKSLGLESYVRFTGRVPYDDVKRYYSIIDIFVVPRADLRVNNMVTPLKPLEAMAMGKAVLASDVDALREMVLDGHTGLVFKADDAHALASQCIRLCGDIRLRERLGKEARAWVSKERCPQNMYERYSAIYTRLAARGGEGS